MVIVVETRDNIIWERDKFITKLCLVMSQGEAITIDLNSEGPDCNAIGMYKLLDECASAFNYNTANITIKTCNVLEEHPTITIKKKLSTHLLDRELNKQHKHVSKDTDLLHFGRLIGKSGAARLFLSEYLDSNYADKTISTYRYSTNDDYHRDDIGLEELITRYGINDVSLHAKFLSKCPISIHNRNFTYDKTTGIDYSTQLHNIEKDNFINLYKRFFVEIVTETYLTGNTFFVTEKIWRPIILKTPFIVHGPTGFLKNLRNLGFKTFHDFWDEGYDEDPHIHSIHEITRVIDTIAKLPVDELHWMLRNMQDILDHNYNRLAELNKDLKQ